VRIFGNGGLGRSILGKDAATRASSKPSRYDVERLPNDSATSTRHRNGRCPAELVCFRTRQDGGLSHGMAKTFLIAEDNPRANAAAAQHVSHGSWTSGDARLGSAR
jgi:hypothetical protein